ncbi:MAG: TolC family protein [Candidatus Methylacidiphilales bacterium]|nr:TolC family protein [Candidatus Methylacidiphilales bacterium]
MEDLVGYALQNNAELRFYEQAVLAAKGLRTQAGLWRNPEFEGEYGERRIKNSSGQLQDEGSARRFSITQSFEFPGKGSLRKAIANKDVEIAQLALKQFRLALSGQVRNLAYRHLLAAARAAAAEEVSERSSGLVDLLKKRPGTGAVQLLELRTIEASLFGLKKEAKEASLEKEETRLELVSLLGLPGSSDLWISRSPSSAFPDLDNHKLILKGLNQNLALKVRILEWEKALREVTAAKMETAPDFAVGPFFSQEQAGEREENIGILFSTTFPLWNWNQGNITTAEARRAQADALLLDARRKVETEIARRTRAYHLSRKFLDEIPPEAVSRMRESSDLADRQYRLGAIHVQLYLETQQAFLNTQHLREKALLETWQNLLDLELLTGETLTDR